MSLRASRLIGAAVIDRQGRQVGRVSDLLLAAPGPASPCYALLDLEPPAHPRPRTVAVPWSLLERDEARGALRLDVSRETLARLQTVGRTDPVGD
jgi:hypothetical protein